MVAGEIQGNIKIKENLELTSTAKIFGDIKTKILNVSPGATLQGKCATGDERKTKFEKIEEKEKSEKQKIKEQEKSQLTTEKIK